MASDDKELWLKEFTEFSQVDTSGVKVPESVFKNLRDKIFPNPWAVFGKVSVLHFVVGFLSLAICNQFGLNPFQTDQSLTAWFMQIGGHKVCMVFCGTFFMATTYLLANFFLTLEELETIKRYEWLQTGITGLISLAAFYFFGAELVGLFVGLWFVGVLVGGFISIEASYRVRRNLAWK